VTIQAERRRQRYTLRPCGLKKWDGARLQKTDRGKFSAGPDSGVELNSAYPNQRLFGCTEDCLFRLRIWKIKLIAIKDPIHHDRPHTMIPTAQ
jgi:hypothetical protein